MDYEETMVETEDFDAAADDTPEQGIEEVDESNEESLESLNDEEEAEPAEDTEEQEPPATEPGWIKKRVNKAVEKAVAETERRMQAKFDAEMAPYRERMLLEEAKELLASGKVKDLETAKELVAFRHNQPQQAEPKQERSRNEKGQYAPREDPAVSARIDMLSHQADTIKARTGVDVIREFESNPEIKQKVISGEMDFYDVAETMKQSRAKRPPAPMRSPNGASGTNPNAIDSMSDEQFARMEKRIREGARYSLK